MNLQQIERIPTTALKVVVAILGVILTGTVYLGLAIARVVLVAAGYEVPEEIWVPRIEWLAFIAAILADSTAQFIGKRATHSDYVAEKKRNSEQQQAIGG